MEFVIDIGAGRPAYQQIEEQVAEAIASGTLGAGRPAPAGARPGGAPRRQPHDRPAGVRRARPPRARRARRGARDVRRLAARGDRPHRARRGLHRADGARRPGARRDRARAPRSRGRPRRSRARSGWRPGAPVARVRRVRSGGGHAADARGLVAPGGALPGRHRPRSRRLALRDHGEPLRPRAGARRRAPGAGRRARPGRGGARGAGAHAAHARRARRLRRGRDRRSSTPRTAIAAIARGSSWRSRRVDDLRDILAELEPELGPLAGEPEVLSGGITNHNLKARLGGRGLRAAHLRQGHRGAEHRPRDRGRGDARRARRRASRPRSCAGCPTTAAWSRAFIPGRADAARGAARPAGARAGRGGAARDPRRAAAGPPRSRRSRSSRSTRRPSRERGGEPPAAELALARDLSARIGAALGGARARARATTTC